MTDHPPSPAPVTALKKGIRAAQDAALQFMVNDLGKDPSSIRLVRMSRLGPDQGWEAKLEVTERNTYLEKLNLPTIFDRNRYFVTLDASLEVVAYAQEGQEGEE